MEDNRLNNLLSYTTFHIGVYISLGTAFIAASVFGHLGGILVKWCVGCFFLAGVCGAVIGSNIPNHATFESFSRCKIGFWGIGKLPYSTWVNLEHIAFWLGNTPIVLGFLFYGTSVFKPTGC